MHNFNTCQKHKKVNDQQDSHSRINCYAEQKQPLGFSSLFEYLNRGRCSVVALIDLFLSSDTLSCQLTGKANIEWWSGTLRQLLQLITGAGQLHISITELGNGVMFI